MIGAPLAASFFKVAVKEYEKLSFTEADAATATLLIYGVCIGVVLAALYTFYYQQVPGGVVRALLRAEAFSEETAKTVEELGLSSLALRELTRGKALRRVVSRVEGENTHYYIPEQDKYRVEIRFDKKGNGVTGLILTAVLSFVLAIVLVKLFPVILNMIDGFMK